MIRLLGGIAISIGVLVGCGGPQFTPDEGRGWWCVSSTGACFRAAYNCIDASPDGHCEHQETAYCFHYSIPVEAERGRRCRGSQSACSKARSVELPADNRVESDCRSMQ